MRKFINIFIAIVSIGHNCLAQFPLTHYEQSNCLESDTYAEVIEFYNQCSKISDNVKIFVAGETDSAFPLHLVLISNEVIDTISPHKDKITILINNSIHPGEPDGMQACMLLTRDIAQGKYKLPDHMILAIIPVYNIGGSLERSAFHRIDQNGPHEKGCRANHQNYDLNRDFIKCDTKESKSFAKIFHELMPDIFIDTHTSNGADYQHTMTLLTSQHNKLGGDLGNFLHQHFEKELYHDMKNKGIDMIPYVNHFGPNPDLGWQAFWDSPRFSSGYATLFNTLSFVPETHMLKTFKARVSTTFELIKSFIHASEKNFADIKNKITDQRNKTLHQKEFSLRYELDSSRYQTFTFHGYAAELKPSNISGLPRLFYNKNKPYEKEVTFYNYFKESKKVRAPDAYIISSGWHKVIDILKCNKVNMIPFTADTTISVEAYKILDYKSSTRLTEGHHTNSDVEVVKEIQQLTFRKGDYYIPMNQFQNRYLVEVLEPESPDGFFVWNFFDSILNQKEGFSAYVFEETAENYLMQHPELKIKLDEKSKTDASFAKNHEAQLEFIFQHSIFFEKAYKRYPVYRVVH